MSNTEILCYVLGWQGGTVHQIASELRVTVETILQADDEQMDILARAAQQARVANEKSWGKR